MSRTNWWELFPVARISERTVESAKMLGRMWFAVAISSRVLYLVDAKRRLVTAGLEVTRENAEFTGAKIVNGVEFEVVLRASRKPTLLFAKGPVNREVNVERSGYPAMAWNQFRRQ